MLMTQLEFAMTDTHYSPHSMISRSPGDNGHLNLFPDLTRLLRSVGFMFSTSPLQSRGHRRRWNPRHLESTVFPLAHCLGATDITEQTDGVFLA
jgi:hypothetical protein